MYIKTHKRQKEMPQNSQDIDVHQNKHAPERDADTAVAIVLDGMEGNAYLHSYFALTWRFLTR
jgi:hypothetical protein